jgi:hypothetical protein
MSMFVGGVLEGVVFPAFHSVGTKATELTYLDFAWHTLPVASEDYGKLFVWAFLAGFAERLVPDSLDRLSSKLEPAKADSSPLALPTGQVIPPSGAALQPPGGAGQPPPDDGSAIDGVAGGVASPMYQQPESITKETLQNAMHSGEPPSDPTDDSKNPPPPPTETSPNKGEG